MWTGRGEYFLAGEKPAGRALAKTAALTDQVLDLTTNGLKRDTEGFQGLCCDALTLVDEPQQDVLGTDVVVVEKARFFLGKYHDPACPVGKPLEQPVSPVLSNPLRNVWTDARRTA